jgi:hypothetical protein
MSDDAEAVRLFYETYGQYLTERQLEHIPDARLRILEQPSDSVPTLASIDQTRWEFEGILTPLELADLCSRQAQHNWTLVQARLARTSKQLELYRAVYLVEAARTAVGGEEELVFERPGVVEVANAKWLAADLYQRAAVYACTPARQDLERTSLALHRAQEAEQRQAWVEALRSWARLHPRRDNGVDE